MAMPLHGVKDCDTVVQNFIEAPVAPKASQLTDRSKIAVSNFKFNYKRCLFAASQQYLP